MGDHFRLADDEFLVAGLGNPGPEYVATRHNFGFMMLDRLLQAGDPAGSFKIREGGSAAVARVRLAGRPVCLVKPLAYMNRSGQVLAPLVAELPGFDLERLLVIHDDLDLPLGRVKLKRGGGSGGHRGVASVIDELGRAEFLRLRLGIDSEYRGPDTVEFVLSRFAVAELDLVEAVLERGVAGLFRCFTAGSTAAMNELNREIPVLVERKNLPVAGSAGDGLPDPE